MRLRLALLATAVLGLALFQAPAARPQTPALSIGLIAPLTGPQAAKGRALVAAASLATEQINRSGGLRGIPLSLSLADDLSRPDPELIARLARQLAAGGVVALVPLGGSATRELVATARGLSVPVIDPLGAVPSGTARAPALYRLAPSAAQTARALAALARGHERVAVLARDGGPHRELAEALEGQLGEHQASLVVYEDTDRPEADAVLAEVPPDATGIVLAAGARDGAALLTQWDQVARPGVRWYMVGPESEAALMASAKARGLEGATGLVPAAAGPRYQAFAEAYEAREGVAPPAGAAAVYDAVMLTTLALAAAPAPTREAVRTQLVAVSQGGTANRTVGEVGFQEAIAMLRAGRDLDYAGASGELDLDAHGEIKPRWSRWRWQRGRIVPLGGS